MPFVAIRDLGRAGVNTDQPPWELQDNEFSRCENVRFINGAVGKTPKPVNVETLAEAPVWALSWIAGGAPQLAYASQDKLYKRVSGTFQDYSNAGGHSPSDDWQAFNWGESAIFNNGADVPQILDPSDTAFADLPNWPSTLRAKVVRGYKAFMVALGVTENGTFNPNVIAWSTEAAPGEVPSTWDAADTTELAGRNPVDYSAGELLDCKPLGDVNMVYGQQAAYAMQFIGGNDVFAFRRVFEEGIICRDAVAAFDRFHLVVGPAQIYVHDGNTPRPVAHNRVQKTFYAELADRNSVRCVTNPKTKEVWICYRTEDLGGADRALVYNYQDNTWTFLTLPTCACAVFGPRQGEALSWDALDAAGLTWDQLAESWTQLGGNEIYPVMYFFDAANNALLEADYLFISDETERFYAERIGLDLEQLLQKPTQQWVFLSRIVPQIEGSGSVNITLGYSDTPTSPVRWQSTPNTFVVGQDYKIDTRIKARYLAIRIESDTPGYWRLTGWDWELRKVDGR